MKSAYFFILYLLFPAFTYAQLGGQQSFSFLQLPANARVTALGSVNVSADAQDPAMFLANPALWNKEAHQKLAFNFFLLNSGANYTTLAYADGLKNGKSQWAAGVQYVHYGTFDGYDNAGNATGSFTARDLALTASFSHSIAPFQLGANVKFVSSGIAAWNANAIMVDFGGAFVHPKQDLRVGLVIKNVGFQVSNSYANATFSMPFDVQLGATYKPENMPFRFSLTAQQLFPNGKNADIDVLRHFIIGTELIPSKIINFRIGYNFLHRTELRVETRRALSGFSFGAMLKVKSLVLAYSRNIRHVAGSLNCLSINIELKNLIKKKTVKE